jgi:hypothetical protein
MSLVWTSEARAKLISRARGEVLEAKRGPIGAAWGSIRKALAQRDVIARTFVEGRERAVPPFDAWMKRCESLARNPTMPTFGDANVAAAFAVLMAKHVDHALVTVVYSQKRGVAFAFDVALRMLAMEVAARPMYLHARTTPVLPDVAWRATLLAQPDEIRAQCIEIAERGWPAASLAQKTTIAYAFFEREDWAREVCRAWVDAGDFPHEALYPIARELDVASALVRKRTQSRSLLELVETFGEAIVPLLAEIASTARDTDARHVAEALAQFEDERAAVALAKLVKFAGARPFVQTYFGRYPRFATALADVGSHEKRAAKIAKEVFAGAKRAEQTHASHTEATPDELPPIFSRPPWREAKRPKRPTRTIANALLDRASHAPWSVRWQIGERERALAIAQQHDATTIAGEHAIAAHARAVARGRAASFFVQGGHRLPDDSTLAAWTAGTIAYDATNGERLRYALAKFDERAADGLVKLVARLGKHDSDDVSILLCVATPRIALAMAQHTRNTTYARLAWQWLRSHDELAVLGLVPAAFDSATREDAERVLLALAASGTDIVAISARYGDEAKSAIEDLLTIDATYDCPKKIPKLGTSWKPKMMTRPVTSSGKVISLEALEVLATMLAFSPLDPPYAGIAIVKETCTARSLAELAWDLARTWEHAGHKRRDQWMLMSLVHFADDEVVRRMTPGIRVDLAVDVLEHIDRDVALMELLTITARATASGDGELAARTEAILDRAAAARGIDKDELEEELAPVKPLEEDGTVSLDFGPRKLRVGFDEQLQPYVINDAGERVRALAAARTGDDPERAERAKELWRDLKEDVAVLAARRIAGLRRAMVSGRTWHAERFRRVWIDNALMKHLARGVVWTDATTSFRVAEDGSLSTSTDLAFTLAPNASVRVLHPLRASRDEIDRWRALFADYRIIQPFTQLERAPLEAPEGERTPWPHAPPGRVNDLVAALSARGFRRYASTGGWGFRRELASRGAIAIEFGGYGTELAEDVEVVFVGKNLDAVEVADVLDELHSALGPPSSA